MKPGHGTLYLVPNTLDFGTAEPMPDIQDILPLGVIRTAARLQHWVVENAKTTRAFLKRVDAVVPLAHALQSLLIVELPRDPKGVAKSAVKSHAPEFARLISPMLAGQDLGLMSEAGLPAVADPGARLVQAAHAAGLMVVALPGPSSLLLAVAASGLNGQHFAFVGYLPVDAAERASRIRDIEAVSRRSAQTQVVIETPYRNGALLTALLTHLHSDTRVSVSCGLTLSNAFSRTDTVAGWRSQTAQLPTNLPAVFSLLAP